MSKAENVTTTTPQNGKSWARALLWREPAIAEPSDVFLAYVKVREYVAANIDAANTAPEIAGQETEIDRLCNLLMHAANPVLNRIPTTPTEVGELAVVLRDELYESSGDTPRSIINNDELTKLLVAAMAAPTLAAAKSAPAAEDWPEWSEWLAAAIEFDAVVNASVGRKFTEAEEREYDDANEARYNRMHALEEAMQARPVQTERHLAMITAIASWHMDRPKGESGFDMRNAKDQCGGRIETWRAQTCARRAAVCLPEVPFKF